MKDNSVEQNKHERSEQKKIIIFSCYGGGGHMSAAKAIENYLSNYQVKIIDAIGGLFAQIDPIYYLTFKYYTGQDFYNYLLRHNRKRITNLFFYFGALMCSLRKKSMFRILEQSIIEEKTDLIISVIPLVNNVLAEISRKHSIPYFLVPTDLDIQSFIKEVQFAHQKNSMLCLGYDYPEIKKCIDEKFIPASHIKVTGFPIRNAFFEKKDCAQIKKDLSIDFSKPVVMLVMGATGSTATLSYLQELIKITVPFHLIICVGRSTSLYKPIEKTTFPDHITYSIFNGNRDISDAMAISDLCITKPGSVTFSEVLYMNIPVIIDNTTPALIWECMNLDMVKNYGLGTIITSYQQIKKIVTTYLIDKELRIMTKNNIVAIAKKDFGKEFKKLVDGVFE
jgi:processive 1,2-diacylglycerol beta-glucosyltransferase